MAVLGEVVLKMSGGLGEKADATLKSIIFKHLFLIQISHKENICLNSLQH